MVSWRQQRAQSGFTLIELLVVIAIIGTLASIVLASLNVARENARDARRMSDITQISRALELYWLEYGEYPSKTWCDLSLGSQNSSCLASEGDWSETSHIHAALVPDYIPDLPIDPINNDPYYYVYEPVVPGDDYCLRARLENGERFRKFNGDTAWTGC